jgi:hypothetical protein
MLSIRQALKTALGASFSVTHQGSPVSIPVVDAGRGAMTTLPCVAVQSEFGVSEASNIGGGAVYNETRCDIEVHVLESDTINGPLLVTEIHSKVEELVRAVEKTLSTSYYSLISTHRDLPAQFVRGFPVFRRVITVSARDLQKY